MATVKIVKSTRAQYDALAVPDPNTIYYVNENNEWDVQSMGENGDIYLGSKLLTGRNAAPGTLDTTRTGAQATNASEPLSGAVALHKISKTGNYADLLRRPLYTMKMEFTRGSGTLPSTALSEGWRTLCTFNSAGAYLLLTYGDYTGNSNPAHAVASISVDYTTATMRLLACGSVNNNGVTKIRLVKLTGVSGYKWRLDAWHGATSTAQNYRGFTLVGTSYLSSPVTDVATSFAATGDTTELPSGTTSVELAFYETTPRNVVDNEIQAGIGAATADVTDSTSLVTTETGGYSATDSASRKRLYRRPATALWNYIKSKIGSVLGITSTNAGTPLAPTAAAGTNTTQIATTAFVNTAVNAAVEDAVMTVRKTENADWVSYNLDGYDTSSGLDYSSTDLRLGNLAAGDVVDVTATLTCGNEDGTDALSVLFRIAKGASADKVDALAQTALTLPAIDKSTLGTATLRVLYTVTASDVTNGNKLWIGCSRLSTAGSPRWYNWIGDAGGNQLGHLSSYTLKVTRTLG